MFYNYVYLNPEKPGDYIYESCSFKFEPFYIGKGSNNRMLAHLKNSKRNLTSNNPFMQKIKDLRKRNTMPIVEIISFFEKETEAYENETKLIKEIGSNYIEEIKNGSLKNICLINQPPNLKGKTYEQIYGKEGAIEQKKKRRELQLSVGGYFGGRKHTEESKLKTSISIGGENHPMFGKHHPENTIKKMSNIKKGKYKGDKNGNAKVFTILSPSNQIYTTKGSLKQFCKNNNLSYSALRKTITNKNSPTKGKTKGWKILNTTKI